MEDKQLKELESMIGRKLTELELEQIAGGKINQRFLASLLGLTSIISTAGNSFALIDSTTIPKQSETVVSQTGEVSTKRSEKTLSKRKEKDFWTRFKKSVSRFAKDNPKKVKAGKILGITVAIGAGTYFAGKTVKNAVWPSSQKARNDLENIKKMSNHNKQNESLKGWMKKYLLNAMLRINFDMKTHPQDYNNLEDVFAGRIRATDIKIKTFVLNHLGLYVMEYFHIEGDLSRPTGLRFKEEKIPIIEECEDILEILENYENAQRLRNNWKPVFCESEWIGKEYLEVTKELLENYLRAFLFMKSDAEGNLKTVTFEFYNLLQQHNTSVGLVWKKHLQKFYNGCVDVFEGINNKDDFKEFVKISINGSLDVNTDILDKVVNLIVEEYERYVPENNDYNTVPRTNISKIRVSAIMINFSEAIKEKRANSVSEPVPASSSTGTGIDGVD